ncbi:hypothetical protein M0638_10165 [Roseomonas sp. NAR14]|uniref:Uncharacterized protein n=1 Tax=Roseomonas acroporae TaxID=2937791 RepID=A0A9X1Y759_9PROT|nr:hypothetical protein [Roseomonas acroporae]MCK8784746.1 hypothetical protein [Roseomonas acroporae]
MRHAENASSPPPRRNDPARPGDPARGRRGGRRPILLAGCRRLDLPVGCRRLDLPVGCRRLDLLAGCRRLGLASLLLLALAGCDGAALIGYGAVEVASVAITGHAVGDLVVSGISGRDCSVVRLDRGESYCRPPEPPPAPPPFCTRSLGSVDCWRVPPYATPAYRGVADGPATLNAEQERQRTRRWPGLF